MPLIETAHRNKDDQKKPTRYYSDKQEKFVAKKFNGKQTKNSGATTFQKGDVCTNNILIECKTKMTSCDSFSIKKEWLEKNIKEALFMGKDYSVLAFNFGPDQPNYFIIDEATFEEFINYLKTK